MLVGNLVRCIKEILMDAYRRPQAAFLGATDPSTGRRKDTRCPGLFVSSGLPLLADSQSILQGGRHFELFNRLLNSVLLIGCLNNSEMFSPSADYIDAPAGHSHINAQCIELKCMTGGASFGREQY